MDENRFNGQMPTSNNQGQQPNPLGQPEPPQQQMNQIPEFSRNFQDAINKQMQGMPPVQNSQTVSSYAEFVKKGGFDKPKNNMAGKIAFSVILLIVVIASVLFLTIKNEEILYCEHNEVVAGVPVSFQFTLTYINDDFDAILVAFTANLESSYESMAAELKEGWEIQGEEFEDNGYVIDIFDKNRVVTLTAKANASKFSSDYKQTILYFYNIDTAKAYFDKKDYECKVE